MNIKCYASHAVIVGGVCFAIGAPSAAARPITDLPMRTAASAHVAAVVTPQPQVRWLSRDDRAEPAVAGTVDRAPAPQVATGGIDWAAWAIGGVALAAVLGLIWLAAAGIARVTRARIVHR